MKKYSFDDHPEHYAELERIKQKYINNAMRTDAMTDYDKSQMRLAMRGLYKNADLDYPGDNKIIFVASPLIAQFASGMAMAFLYGAANAADDAAINAARNASAKAAYDAVRNAADAARNAAFNTAYDAARNAADAARNAAINAARNAADNAAEDAADNARDAAYDAAYDAENAANNAENAADDAAINAARNAADDAAINAADNAEIAAYAAVRNAAEDADIAARNAAINAVRSAAENAINEKDISLSIFINAFLSVTKKYGKFALLSSSFAWRYRSRGAFWPWYQVFGDFFKNVAKLPGDWEKWEPINLDALHGGVRFMTPEFTIISDRPSFIKLDEQGQLHNETGAAMCWRDGMEQYYWHGTPIPDWWIARKELLTPQIALTWENVEQRRCACEILGWVNVLEHPSLNPRIIDEDSPEIGILIEVDLPDAPNQRFLKYRCGTGRWFAESVNDRSFDTALKANAGGNGWRGVGDPAQYIPIIRT